MLFNALSLLPLLSLIAASPTPLAPRATVETTYRAINPGGFCGPNAPTYIPFNGTITSPFCEQSGVSSVLITRLPGVDCKATIYNGFNCVPGTETSVTDLPAGSGDVCIVTGAYQGICSHCPQISFGYTCV